MRPAVAKTTLVLVSAAAALTLWASSASAAEEFDRYALEFVSASLSTTQAGAHADLTTTLVLTHSETGLPRPYAYTRDVEIITPPGMIGNPQGIPRCTVKQLGVVPGETECPVASQVGVSELVLGGGLPGAHIVPVYNMTRPGGDVVARLGFIAGIAPAFVNFHIDPTDYSLIASIEGAPAAALLVKSSTTIWGVPAASVHDKLRFATAAEKAEGATDEEGRSARLPPAPFLSNPTDCGFSRQINITARSYQLPESPSTMSAPFPQITGCGKLSFEPGFTASPNNPEAAAPTGLDSDLTVPQDETPQGLSTSALKSAVVSLPEGMTINPSAADGLGACSAQEVGFEQDESSHCPDAAKIGSVEVDVPALEHTLHGAVYQRTPEPGHLFRFWVVTDDQGVHLKLPAEIQANPLTGQLTAVFAGIPALGGLPQFPFADLKLHVFGGPRAPLATPDGCGTYQTHYSFTPWSGKAPVENQTPMQIIIGCGRGGFAPKLVAGPLNYGAGSFSPFTFTLTREDGEANPRTVDLHLPQGLLAKLRGVPLCSDAGATTGTCPAGSAIGTFTTATGVGGAPLWIPQPGKAPTAVYLAGPYKGAPYSVVAVVPAQAGPFDLGTVVNRAGIHINPETALATIKTDPLPQILEGVPVSYRTLNVLIDRKDFTLNPTSCAQKKITAAVTAVNGGSAEPAVPFKATNCANLTYSPKLKLSLKGSTKRSGNPALRAVLTQKPHQANTATATVILPSSEFIDNAHINNPCTRVQFNEGKCPKASILGHAEARTPLLNKPLRGPVYFRSNGGARELPDIVADLRGQIHITLVGYIDSVHKKGSEVSRVRTRFLHVPDAPVTKFTMNLHGGAKGLIENHVDLCRAKHRAELEFEAQTGRSKKAKPTIKVRCAEKKR